MWLGRMRGPMLLGVELGCVASLQSSQADHIPIGLSSQLVAAAAAQHDGRLMTEAPGSGVSTIGGGSDQPTRRPGNRSYGRDRCIW